MYDIFEVRKLKRQTKQKEQLRLYLQTQDKAFVVKDIVLACKPFASQATVYRMIEELIASGDIVVCESQEGYVYRYAKHDCKAHYHLVCRSCHQVYHIHTDIIEALSTELMNQYHFQMDHQITLQGACQTCLKKLEVS